MKGNNSVRPLSEAMPKPWNICIKGPSRVAILMNSFHQKTEIDSISETWQFS
jgi:hypothetical protein